MHIIKVEYALINVCFHLLVVLASMGRFLVASLDNKRRDSQISPEKQLRSMAWRQCWSVQPWEAKMELRVCFPALIVQEQAGCKGNVTQSPFLL